jgi:hypothetical protein
MGLVARYWGLPLRVQLVSGDESYRGSSVCVVAGIRNASCCVFHNVLECGRPGKLGSREFVALVCMCEVFSTLGLTAQLYRLCCSSFCGTVGSERRWNQVSGVT